MNGRRVLALPGLSSDRDADVDTQSIESNLNLCQMGGDKDVELVHQTAQPTPVRGGMAGGGGGGGGGGESFMGDRVYTLMKEDSLAPESRRLIREVTPE